MQHFAPSFYARLLINLKTASIIMTPAVCVMVVLNLLDPPDGDMIHEYYYGQRLFCGELIWTREFHDKLPFVQWLMAVPGSMQSVALFQIFTLCVTVVGSVALVKLVPKTVQDNACSAAIRHRAHVFAALLFVCLLVTLPGYLFNLHAVSTPLALIGFLGVWARAEKPDAFSWLFVVSTSFCAAMAISLRPYHIAPLMVVVAWTSLMAARNVASPVSIILRLRIVLRMVLPWAGAIGAWGFVMNILPYMMAQQMSAFWDGLSMLAGGNMPNNGVLGFLGWWIIDVRILVFWLAMLLIGGLAWAGCCRGGRTEGAVIMLVLAVLGMVLLILKGHSWAGYNQMFAGFLPLLTILLTERVMAGQLQPAIKNAMVWIFPVLPLVVAGLFAFNAAKIVGQYFVTGKPEPKAAQRLAAFNTYLERTGQQNVAFLAPFDMDLHWRLGQSRLGFPHTSHTVHIFEGWWVGVKPYSSFPTPSTPEAYCRLLDERGPPLLVDPPQVGGLSCVTGTSSVYRLDAVVSYGSAGKMAIYKRKE